MSTVAPPLTVEQFLALPEDESIKRELIGGEVFAMPRARQQHEFVKANFIGEFYIYFKQHGNGRVLSETGYRLSSNDAPQPDVSVHVAGNWDPANTGLIAHCPNIVVEVVSSESAAFLRSKVKLYLRYGAHAVCVAYPEHREVIVHDRNGARELSEDQFLEFPDLLHGFSVPISAFFDGI